MGRPQSDITRLDLTITALEHLVLAASDREILADGATDAHYIRGIIDKGIAKCDASPTQSRYSEQNKRSKSKKSRSELLGDWQAKSAFFRDLMATRPDLSPRFGAVFGAGRTPTSEELDELTDELIGLGLISKYGPKEK